MDDIKKERYTKLLWQNTAEFISSISTRASLITVTNVTLAGREKKVHIHLSVYPETEETKAIAFLERHVYELRDYLKDHMRIGFLPVIEFGIDEGEKARQKFDELLHKEKGGATDSDIV
jgi:ribosome-binding factor A